MSVFVLRCVAPCLCVRLVQCISILLSLISHLDCVPCSLLRCCSPSPKTNTMSTAVNGRPKVCVNVPAAHQPFAFSLFSSPVLLLHAPFSRLLPFLIPLPPIPRCAFCCCCWLVCLQGQKKAPEEESLSKAARVCCCYRCCCCCHCRYRCCFARVFCRARLALVFCFTASFDFTLPFPVLFLALAPAPIFPHFVPLDW